MQTPTHVAVSLFVWQDSPNWKQSVAVVFGAMLPDITMFIFYGYQKVAGSSERDIWGTLYFQEHWQLFFDLFNSIPIFLILAILSAFFRWRIGVVVWSSALLHVLCDLPVHNVDAHRHFLPFTNWRFISPVSYWDPKHFGIYVMFAELISSVTICSYLLKRQFSKSIRIAAGINLSLFGLAIVAGLFVWWKMSAS